MTGHAVTEGALWTENAVVTRKPLSGMSSTANADADQFRGRRTHHMKTCRHLTFPM
jgi:hypothetical protein